MLFCLTVRMYAITRARSPAFVYGRRTPPPCNYCWYASPPVCPTLKRPVRPRRAMACCPRREKNENWCNHGKRFSRLPQGCRGHTLALEPPPMSAPTRLAPQNRPLPPMCMGQTQSLTLMTSNVCNHGERLSRPPQHHKASTASLWRPNTRPCPPPTVQHLKAGLSRP